MTVFNRKLWQFRPIQTAANILWIPLLVGMLIVTPFLVRKSYKKHRV